MIYTIIFQISRIPKYILGTIIFLIFALPVALLRNHNPQDLEQDIKSYFNLLIK